MSWRQRALVALVALVAPVALPAVAAGCSRAPDDPLAGFAGGFDPVRFDGGVPPSLDGVALGRPLRLHVPPFYAERVHEGAAAALEVYLERSVGVDVEIRSLAAYGVEQIGADLRAGEIDVAELSPYQLALLEPTVPMELVATTVAYGSASYGSYLVTRAEAPLDTLADLSPRAAPAPARRTLGLVDPTSTSGYLVPRLFLQRAGLELERDFDVRFLGSHPAVIAAVRDGKVDVGAVSSDLLIGNAGLAGPLKVIARLGRMPTDVIVARKDLPRPLVVRVQHALFRLSIHDRDARAALRAFSSVDGFMPIPPGHYDEIRALAREAQPAVAPPTPPTVP